MADLKAERATLGAKGRQIDTEAAPIQYAAAESESTRTATGRFGG